MKLSWDSRLRLYGITLTAYRRPPTVRQRQASDHHFIKTWMALALDVIPRPQPPPSTVELLPARVVSWFALPQDKSLICLSCCQNGFISFQTNWKSGVRSGSRILFAPCLTHWRQTSPALSAHPSSISKLAACSVSHSFPDVRHRLGDLRATWILIFRRPPFRVRVTDFCITNPSFLTPPQPPS